MDEHHDIYQTPAAPPPEPGPLPSYDLRPDQARLKVRRQTAILVTVITLLLALAAIHFIVQESHWTKTAQLREALSTPLFAHTPRTNVIAGSLAPQVAPMPDNFDQELEAPPANVSPARMAEAMGHLRIGNEYLRARDLQRAEEEVRGALAIWPNMNAGLRMLGMIHIQRGQFDQAIVALERAQRSDPFSAETYNNLATAYMHKRMLDRAEELLLTSLQIRPGFSVAELNLGLLYILWGRYDEAIGHLEGALVQLPDNPSVLNNIGVCKIRLGRYDEAQGPLLRLVEQSSANAAPYFNLAITYTLKDQYAEALARIRQGAEHCSPTECLTYLKDTDFDRLRKFPEYQQFVRGLYPELPSLPPGPET